MIEQSMKDPPNHAKEMVSELLLQGKSLYLEVQEYISEMPHRNSSSHFSIV